MKGQPEALSKAAELAKVARRDGKDFDCAIWLHKARSLQTEEFKVAVDRHLTGHEAALWATEEFRSSPKVTSRTG